MSSYHTIGVRAEHRDPATVSCEWCRQDTPSVRAIPNKRSLGTFIYVCDRHVETAERMNTNKPRSGK